LLNPTNTPSQVRAISYGTLSTRAIVTSVATAKSSPAMISSVCISSGDADSIC
jgi:hypothetical protein